MGDLRAAKILSHERNIQRYCRLLATELTELERRYLHERIAEERAELERWSRQDQSADDASNVIAAQALSNKQDGKSHVKDAELSLHGADPPTDLPGAPGLRAPRRLRGP